MVSADHLTSFIRSARLPGLAWTRVRALQIYSTKDGVRLLTLSLVFDHADNILRTRRNYQRAINGAKGQMHS